MIEINIVSSDLSSRRARLYSKKLLQAVGSIILSHCYSRGGPQNIAGQSQAMRGSHIRCLPQFYNLVIPHKIVFKIKI